MKKFRLFGYPLNYSLSPIIHKLFAQQFGLDISYDIQAVNSQDFSLAVTNFIAAGGHGINVTAPYKELAFQQLTNLRPYAKIAHAVNTIMVQADGTLCGDNTDGIGFSRDLQLQDIHIAHKQILILGAGGAVRGILAQLLLLQPSSIFLLNRDVAKAELIASDFAAKNVVVKNINELSSIKAEVIIHAISANILPTELPEYKKINFANAVCYDLNYQQKITPFLELASINGASKTINGLGMLVEQAAAAFYLWHKIQPNTKNVLAQLQRIAG